MGLRILENGDRLRRCLLTVTVLGACAAPLSAAAGPAAGAGPRCAGKPATIVSDAARIVGTRGHDVIVGGAGANLIRGEGGNDTICAGGGADEILGGRGNDRLMGGPGADTIGGGRGSDRIDGGAGRDRLAGDSGNDAVQGGAGGRDLADGGPGDDAVGGGPGAADVVHGGIGDDSADGGPGAHDIVSFRGAAEPIQVDLGAGRADGAEIEPIRRAEDVIGGSAGDVIIGAGPSANRLDGGPGDDRLVAVGAGDEAFGGPGRDACDGPHADAVSCGEQGRRDAAEVELYTSIAEGASLVISAGGGAEEISVGFERGAFVVRGAGPDTAVTLGDPGSERCTRALEANTVACVGAVDSILVTLGGGDDRLEIAESVPPAVGASVDGGRGSDVIAGGPGRDALYGGDDRLPDTLLGGAGDDALFGVNISHPRHDSGAASMSGGAGDDLLVGGQPCDGDVFDGGSGFDSASFARIRNPGIQVVATIGGAVLDPDVPGCTGGLIRSGVEKIEGSPGPDVLSGDEGPNTLLGRGGNDVLDGRGGFDDCVGGNGRDSAAACERSALVP